MNDDDRYIHVTTPERSVVVPIDEFNIFDFVDEMGKNDTTTLKLKYMTDEEYEALPEFEA